MAMDDEAIGEVFSGVGSVAIRKMFGGRGIFYDGLIVGLEVDGEILLKADKQNARDFEAAGATQWIYNGKKKPILMPYWSVPDAALDDPDELARWTRKALEGARRSASR